MFVIKNIFFLIFYSKRFKYAKYILLGNKNKNFPQHNIIKKNTQINFRESSHKKKLLLEKLEEKHW
jgi:hypothetical protein